MQIHTIVPRHIITVTDLLDRDECDRLIEQSEGRGFRSPSGPHLHPAHPARRAPAPHFQATAQPTVNRRLWSRLRRAAPKVLDGWISVGLSDRLHFYRHGPGQLQTTHRDIPFQDGECCSHLTLICFLNEDFRGGDFVFKHVRIRPRTGLAVLFRQELQRENQPILTGCKYMLRGEVMYRPMPTTEMPTGAWRLPLPKLVEGTR